MKPLRHLLLPAILAAGAAAGACSEIGTDPSSPVSIRFDTLPALAVVEGDTLRDSLGFAAALSATAFNSGGGVIGDAPFAFIARDSSNVLTVDPTGRFVVARDSTARATDVTLQASLGNLQFTRPLAIVPRPDSLAGPATPVTVALVQAPDTAALRRKNLSGSFTVRVLHDSTPEPTPVRSWLVSFVVDADSLDRTRLDSARLVDPNGVFRSATTTGADGGATLQLRVYPRTGATNGLVRDSVIVRAIARYRNGAQLRGSPARIVVPVGICTGPTAGCLSAAAGGGG